MARIVLRRLVTLPLLLLCATFVVFSLVLLVPGDPAVTLAGDNPTPEKVAEIREELGLDRPVVVQYGSWLGDLLTGDAGTSISNGQSVNTAVSNRLPATLSLTLLSLAMAGVGGVALGVAAALGARHAWGKAVSGVISLGIAVPYYWIALLLLTAFAVGSLRWFPATGYVELGENPAGWLSHLFLPALALAARPAAEVGRHTRSAMLEVLRHDYIRTAVAKGIPRRTVIVRHALKNGLVPSVTVLGLQVSALLGGTVVVERIFSIPGIGQLIWNATFSRDLPVIQGVVILAVLIAVVANVVVDLTYLWLNPRVRTES